MKSENRPLYWDSILFRFQPYLTDFIPECLPVWTEKQSTLYETLPPPNDGIFLDAYLQSSKYFHKHKDEIKHLLKPSEEELDHILTKYRNLVCNKANVVVIHARRTDYLIDNGQFHGPLHYEYYNKAIQYMKATVEIPMFLLASDDHEYWAKAVSNIDELKNQYVCVLQENEIETFQLLQQFHHYVIANSTFSWWFAWLADAKTVVAPNKWCGPSGPQNNEGIYEPSWVRI